MGLAAVGAGSAAPSPSQGLLVREELHVVEIWARYHDNEFQLAWKRLQAIAIGLAGTGSGSSLTNAGQATVNGPAWQSVALINTTYGTRWGFFELTGPGGVKSGIFTLLGNYTNQHVVDGFEIEESLGVDEAPTQALEFPAPAADAEPLMRIPPLPKVKTGLLRKLFGMDRHASR